MPDNRSIKQRFSRVPDVERVDTAFPAGSFGSSCPVSRYEGSALYMCASAELARHATDLLYAEGGKAGLVMMQLISFQIGQGTNLRLYPSNVTKLSLRSWPQELSRPCRCG